MAKVIGIDLGTSNSAAAVIMGGKPTIIPAAEGATVGGKAFPSVVAFSKDGELLVGEPARRQAITNPDNTILAAKRKMGSDHTFKIQGKEYKPQQISAFILQKIKKDSEAFVGESVEKAVITVPAYFDDNQRQATKDAGTIAGLDVVRIINEPTAASLAFGLDKAKEDMKILVFDFGGGTLDVTIMEMGGGVFEVLSTSGDTQLGGTDMDKILIDYIIDEFKKKEGIDLSKDTTATARIRESAEKAKIELSTVMETDVTLPFIAQDSSTGAKNLELRITRAKLDELIGPIVKRCKPCIVKAFEDAKLSHSDINKIVMVGGPTRMPLVRKMVGEVVGKEPESGVDPMEAVAMGAAIQAGIIAGDVTSDIVLLDVTPLTLGIETLGGVREPLIERNTTIPTSKSKVFTTAADNQTAVTIHVVQGERPMASDNVSLGSFNLTDVPPAPRGVPQIDVKFDIDANGIINVTAKDLGTQKEAKITIESSSKLSKEEIEKLKEDAKKFSEEDEKKKEKIDLKNEAESYIYTTEKLVNHDLKDKISQEQGIKITDAVKEVKEVLDKEPDELKPKLEALQSIVSEVTTELYKNASPPPDAEGQQDTSAEGQQDTSAEGQQDTSAEGQQDTSAEGQQDTSAENKTTESSSTDETKTN
ncbi:molecular chaperone DnaK [Marine Group I thaumarchaeote]|uniref:Chaperone protein DnaK n=1 Tax=Marine Group I thaumarchaeote TaxID=2511932 RepID=A0A7K4P6J2_9ARCH|nr:molecular chaperone DnaK [Marine Group I thaumarchaeote]NWK01539.1 molecular chaperone DnaK [Marine Group I thaumarchaeote]NWK07464.1 molecular chaperone DnaK [Marine Group I thaumarchaeote]NWK08641.1 molecular chaperone DnaK [Marine Group I thaumarchaeote]NWK14330.1 molecular chaperone DnaK [Marine Group I thaumarchaeote]